MAVEALPDARAPAAAEAAMYRLVAASLRLGPDVRLAIDAEDGELDATSGRGRRRRTLAEALAHAGARVAALGGELAVSDATARGRVPA